MLQSVIPQMRVFSVLPTQCPDHLVFMPFFVTERTRVIRKWSVIKILEGK